MELTSSPSSTTKSTTQISMVEFFKFLRIAYQMQESLEMALLEDGLIEAVHWLKHKKDISGQNTTTTTTIHTIDDNKITDQNNLESVQSSCANITTTINDVSTTPEHVTTHNTATIHLKLDEVISEGLLDSVLTYIIPTQDIITCKGQIRIVSAVLPSSSQDTDCDGDINTEVVHRTDSDVEIHVCDEMRNERRDFYCNYQLLISRMQYFRQVTAGQDLHDTDISVHCDIGIFEWLMRWVKDDDPILDAQCVIPILVSAAFLQMEPLLYNCLLYCHNHMDAILNNTATNLSCLNDTILIRLAAMYTNSEVESIHDRKDRIQSRLYTKLIQSLVEVEEAEAVRGHWMSLAHLYRCLHCQQLINSIVGPNIWCTCAANQRLRYDGTIVTRHPRDPLWSINTHITGIYKSVKSWRRVYWKLWGQGHFLYCSVCHQYFACTQMSWCRYHPQAPQFFTTNSGHQQMAVLPVGRYPCCGETAYRFQLLENRTGCQYREHLPTFDDTNPATITEAILHIFEKYRDMIETSPPLLVHPERLTRLIPIKVVDASDLGSSKANVFWWEGLQITPPRPKLGLLTDFNRKPMLQQNRNGDSFVHDESTPQSSSTTSNSEDNSTEDEDSSSTTSYHSEEPSCSNKHHNSGSIEANPTPRKYYHHQKKIEKLPKSSTKSSLKHHHHNNSRKIRMMTYDDSSVWWQHNLSARSNQDIQRAYEERAITNMLCTILSNKNTKSPTSCRDTTCFGGLWVRLYSDWLNSHPLMQDKFNTNKKQSPSICTAGSNFKGILTRK